MSVLVIAGTRPEVIKVAPIVRFLKQSNEVPVHLAFTGQHKDLDPSLSEFFAITPDSTHSISKPGQSLSELGAQCLITVSKLIDKLSPSIVLVQGDTATTFFSAVASFNASIPVVHLEAGLRTQALGSPFPEEGYRQMVSRISEHHFAPTQSAKDNLILENVTPSTISVVGNSVVDATEMVMQHFASNPGLSYQLTEKVFSQTGISATRKFVLVTVHRRENIGPKLAEIIFGISNLARVLDEYDFLWVLHPNPELQQSVRQAIAASDNIKVVQPMGYLEMSLLLSNCYFVITDSGGLQEEAPSYQRFSLVLRESTERPEAVEQGLSWLVGTDGQTLQKGALHIIELLNKEKSKEDFGKNPFGNGKTGARVGGWLESWSRQNQRG